MNVLLVDDSKTMRNIQKAALALIGPVTVTEAADGAEGLKSVLAAAAAATPFDLVLVDWNMPNMNGLEMVQAARKAGCRSPMVMVTTEGEKDRVLEAIRAGANNYMLKPFKPEDLVAKVQATLAKAKAA